ncbi:MAG: peptide/nickel transport system permease protein [Halanaerobium sp.]|jgi:peptide/nickel transport system permease protein|uniref:Peptide/nickel transport system permease protein n=1 Tax=Halanaerobium saccharolyticum TaxID=43595 RepID=A0A4R6S3C1_9FIRM|nr:ABC transporter permease [Halanaerobium saccharolyticum]PUU95500.1 MAG: peptide/nickel transport system permease protein [Halanaerobium sp.]TDP93577.1 peptide/nickel transport system permease protein [Halanaerobium saccharolyticum]
MWVYTFRRLLTIIPTLLVASIIIFSFMHLMPGDPAAVMLGTNATPEQVERLRTQMGLNRPIYIQFSTWIRGAFVGDLGESIFFQSPVMSVIRSRAETSILIAFFSMILILTIGVPVGVISAVKNNTLLDQFSMGFAMLAASIPTFWLGLNLMIIFSVNLGWLPSSGFPSVIESGNLMNLKYLILPCLTLAAPNSALIIRLTRSSMLDVMSEEYVKTARAKGLKESEVVIKHIFRNAIISVVSALGFTFIALLSGTVVTETVFSLPGVGSLVVQSVLRRDYPVIQGVIFVVVILYVLINLLTDLSYGFLDPRITYD